VDGGGLTVAIVTGTATVTGHGSGTQVRASSNFVVRSAGRVGASVFTNIYPGYTTRPAAAKRFATIVGRPAALEQKVYLQDSQWATTVNSPQPVGEMTAAGIKIVLCVKPAQALGLAEQKNLAATLALYTKAGADIDMVVPWQEPNHPAAFPTAIAYQAYFAGCSQVIRDAGLRAAFCPALAWPTTTLTYYPGHQWTDVVLFDMYGGEYARGLRAEPLIAIADDGRKPVGVGEWGPSDSDKFTPTPAQFAEFCQYLISLFNRRLNAGLVNGPIMYFGGLTSTSPGVIAMGDYRAPLVAGVYDALST
jgi:hypothetical protein